MLVTYNGQSETEGHEGAEEDAVHSLPSIIIALNKMPVMFKIPVGPVKGTLQRIGIAQGVEREMCAAVCREAINSFVSERCSRLSGSVPN